MDTEAVTKAEYQEFTKRMDDEHKRQNHRLELLEEQTKQIMDITVSVKELATSVKQMAETQKVQSDKLEKLEDRDGQMWRQVVGYVITAIIGLVIGYMSNHIPM